MARRALAGGRGLGRSGGTRGVYMPRTTPLVSMSVRLPRKFCSSSKALNSALKLPAPKPCSRSEEVSCESKKANQANLRAPSGLLGTGAPYLVVVALNDLQEECGPVLHGLGEDL